MLELTLYALYLTIAITLTTLLVAEKISTMIIALIATFINIFIYLFVLNAEFLSISFLIIYVGAITILFVFSLMVVNTKTILEWRSAKIQVLVAMALLAHLGRTLYKSLEYKVAYTTVFNLYSNVPFRPEAVSSDYNKWWCVYQTDDILLFANVLYTKYQGLFILSGCLLLTSVIGVIALTLPSRIKRN